MTRTAPRATAVQVRAAPRTTPRATPRTTPVQQVRAISPHTPLRAVTRPLGSAGQPMTTCGHVGGYSVRHNRNVCHSYWRIVRRTFALSHIPPHIASKGPPQ